MGVTTNRGTILAHSEYSIYTVEHILSALNGLEIDNVEIIVEGEEIPSCDGSAKIFVDKLKRRDKNSRQGERYNSTSRACMDI